MLAAIGETFDPAHAQKEEKPGQSLITGVIVSTRPQFYRVSIWTRISPTSAEEDVLRQRIETVGKHFKMSVLGFSESQKLAGPLATEVSRMGRVIGGELIRSFVQVEYLSHKDSEKKGKAAKKIVV